MDFAQLKPAYELTSQIQAVLERHEPYRASVSEFTQLDSEDGVIDVLELNFEIVGLCQYPLYEIRSVEPITIFISDADLPKVFVREDFPTTPHLIISQDGKMRHLCYTDLGYNDVRHKLNGRFIVECVNTWFVKTARNELHRDDQPLEPFFYGTHDVIIINPFHINGNFAKFKELYSDSRFLLKQISDSCAKSAEARLYVIIRLELPPSSENIIHYPPATLFELLVRFDALQLSTQFVYELWSILKIRQNQNEFEHILDSKTASLLNCPCIITLKIPQKRTLSETIERSDYRVFATEKSFGDVLFDFGIEREKKKGQKTNRPVATGKNNGGVNISIRQLDLHWANTATLARLYNGIDTKYKHLHYVLIGAGALGSQIFANCIRSGFGKWSIVDKDIVFPHNLARHILMLDSIGQSKATALENYGRSIVEDAEIVSVAEDVFDLQNNGISETLNTADVIVDVSTSVAVERMLALDINSQAQRISLFLNPCGTHLVMLCEDVDRTVTLDLLEMQLYSILSTKEEYSEYFKLASTIAYTTSCRDITSKISQDSVALCAAVISKELKRIQTIGSASIVIWAIDDNGINADRYDGLQWVSLPCGDWKIVLQSTLLQLLQTKRAERQPNETGGVLIGQYDFSRNIIYIADMIFSPDDSIVSPTSYIRGCKNLPEQIQQISEQTYRNFNYIGEWHSHPGSSTDMSSADETLLNTLSIINEAECLIGCLFICGAEGKFSLHIRENGVTFSSSFRASDIGSIAVSNVREIP